MRAHWRIFVNAKSERSANVLLKRVARALEIDPELGQVEPYWKGGFVLSFDTTTTSENWPEAVMELLIQGQRMCHSFHIGGFLDEALNAWSNESSISGVQAVDLRCFRHEGEK